MKIDKAIELLKGIQYLENDLNTTDIRDAVQLGIEALKQMKSERTIYGFKRHGRMPTEET